jgi:hypothetical protein
MAASFNRSAPPGESVRQELMNRKEFDVEAVGLNHKFGQTGKID